MATKAKIKIKLTGQEAKEFAEQHMPVMERAKIEIRPKAKFPKPKTRI